MLLIKYALMKNPFRYLRFVQTLQNYNDEVVGRGGMSTDAIIDIMESNTHLCELEIENYQMGGNDAEKLCSAVRDLPP